MGRGYEEALFRETAKLLTLTQAPCFQEVKGVWKVCLTLSLQMTEAQGDQRVISPSSVGHQCYSEAEDGFMQLEGRAAPVRAHWTDSNFLFLIGPRLHRPPRGQLSGRKRRQFVQRSGTKLGRLRNSARYRTNMLSQLTFRDSNKRFGSESGD